MRDWEGRDASGARYATGQKNAGKSAVESGYVVKEIPRIQRYIDEGQGNSHRIVDWFDGKMKGR